MISRDDNSPLPFATVTNLTQPYIISTDEHGIAKLKGKVGDTISLSYVGFQTATVRLNTLKGQVVGLIREPKVLSSITIKNCKKTQEHLLNNFKNQKELKENGELNKGFGGIYFPAHDNKNNPQIAVLLKPQESLSTLRKFSFWLANEWGAPDSAIRTPMIISFYEADENSGLPKRTALTDPLIYFPKKEGKQNLNLDTLNLGIPTTGIYVSLAFVMNEKYQWKHKSKWKANEKDTFLTDTTYMIYGFVIKAARTRDFNFVSYNSITDRWFTTKDHPINDGKFHSTIKCEAVIRYCKE